MDRIYSSRTCILRDAPRFSGEQSHLIEYKETLDDALYFHSSKLHHIIQGQARPDKYMLVSNDVLVISRYVESPRSVYEAKHMPRATERDS